MVISLIGYRATGKSTVASLLSERLGWSWADSDDEIQRVTGKTIRSIFQEQGESVFRDYEAQVIRQLTRRHKLVLSLGGGAVLREDNRQAIAVAGPVIWLSATPDTIRSRLQNDPATSNQRPSLTGAQVDDEVEQVLQGRLPMYESCADYTIPTDDLPPTQIVEAILADLDLPPLTPLS